MFFCFFFCFFCFFFFKIKFLKKKKKKKKKEKRKSMACTRHLLEGVSYAKTLRYTTSNCITIRHESIQKLCFCLRTWLLSNTVVRATMYLLFYSSTTRHKSKKDILFENIVYAFVFKATRLLCWRSSLLHNTILKQNCFFTVESLNYFVFFLCFLN
jgi:ATP sulfurylase